MASRRLIFDVSTLVRAAEETGGIIRVVRELAVWTCCNRDDVVFVTYNWETRLFHVVDPAWAKLVFTMSVKFDTSELPDRWRTKPKLRDRLPLRLRRWALWAQHPRRRAILALEGRRLKAESPAAAEKIERLQAKLLSHRYRDELFDRFGRRRALVPYYTVVGPAHAFRQDDILVLTGAEWGQLDPALYRSLKVQHGIRIAVFCHDILPALYPDFFQPPLTAAFIAYIRVVLPLADLVMFHARTNEQDVRRYCESEGLVLSKTSIVPMGADFARTLPQRQGPLPDGLEPQRYALFVSTIEPRKQHRLLFSVWKRLLAEGVPQASRFKLVFVGRRGWLVDDLLAEIDEHPSAGDSLLLFSNVPDETLAELYTQCAFCLFPSLYEGYGLPIIEAFGYGKAVLASTGGAVPEVVGGLSPCLDPRDEDSWYMALKLWIEQPEQPRHYEELIRDHFRPTTWNDAARAFFETIDKELP
jgi:glycosyltransferase involved in cell wall biosynthesis